MDFATVVAYLTLDVITDLAFGSPLGFVRQDKDVSNYVKELEIGLNIGLGLSMVPWLMRLFKTSFMTAVMGDGPPGAAATTRKAVRIQLCRPILTAFSRLAGDVAKSRSKADAGDFTDMIGSFIRHGLDESQLQIEIFSQMYVPSQVVSFHIHTHPCAQVSRLRHHRNSNTDDDSLRPQQP